jgi:ribosomal protein S18 acetylase RimI-like enzyme
MAGSRIAVEVTIRPALPADREALVDLDLASAAHHAALDPNLYRVADRDAVARFLDRRLADPDRQVLVAVAGGAVVGMVDVTMEGPPDEGSVDQPIQTADLGISVLGAWRNRGVGHALMAAAEALARERGAEQIVLDMASANVDALRFYRGLGYAEHGLLLRRSLSS